MLLQILWLYCKLGVMVSARLVHAVSQESDAHTVKVKGMVGFGPQL